MIFFNNKEQVIYLQNYRIHKITPMETGTLEVYKLLAHDADPMITYNIDSYEVTQVASYENIMTEIDATAGVEIVADFAGVDHIGGVNCLVECEPNPDWVTITINVTAALESGTDVEVNITQNEPKWIIWKGSPYTYEFIQTIVEVPNAPTTYTLTINKNSVKGLYIGVGSGGAVEVSGLDQIENLEVLKIIGGIPYSKIIGKLPRFLKHLDMSYSKMDDIDTTANTLLCVKLSAVDCPALGDWLEKMPESCIYAIIQPTHRVGEVDLAYPLSVNNSGRLTVNTNCIYMGLYFGNLTFDQIKILYNLFEGIQPIDGNMYLYFEWDTAHSETHDYITDTLIPMLESKNIGIGEY